MAIRPCDAGIFEAFVSNLGWCLVSAIQEEVDEVTGFADFTSGGA